MKLKHTFYIFIAGLLSVGACRDVRIKEHNDWAKFYEAYGIKKSCFEVVDQSHEIVHYYNKERCLQRFPPASTFKIFNSLAGLESAVAPDDKLIIKWDSTPRRPEWDKDMDMQEAIKVSCLPYYQELARRIGRPRMQHYLDTAHYGNMKIGEKVDIFWLDNSLQISADEQVGLIKRMYFNELPFSERSQRIVRSLLLREDSTDMKDSSIYRLSFKTGTVNMNNDSTVYWVVGFEEIIKKVKEPKGSMNKTGSRNYPYFFAQNFSVARNDTSQNWFKVRLDILHQMLDEFHQNTAKPE